MSSESALWKLTKEKLSPYGQLIRIEDRLAKGTPDLIYNLRRQNRTTSGWIELKHIHKWPKSSKTPIVVPSLKIEQVIWAERWHSVGGRVYTLLQIGQGCYALLLPASLRELYAREYVTANLITTARVYSASGFPTVEILEAIT